MSIPKSLIENNAMLEVEIKAVLNDNLLQSIRSKLEEINCSRIENVMYEDMYLDTVEKNLTSNDAELRLRRITGDITRAELTYKGPPFEPQLTSRSEYELGIDSYGNMLSILNSLGYRLLIKFKQIRTNYYLKYKGYNIMVSLVRVPQPKSQFAELEKSSKQVSDTNRDVKILKDFAQYLGISKNNLISSYYRDMERNIESQNKTAETHNKTPYKTRKL